MRRKECADYGFSRALLPRDERHPHAGCIRSTLHIVYFLAGDKIPARERESLESESPGIIPATINEAPTYPTGYRVSFVQVEKILHTGWL